MSLKIVPFSSLDAADLYLDAIYEEQAGGQLAGEALGKLLPVGNQGGLRGAGQRGGEELVALFTSGTDPDWPDVLDLNTGLFTYYGDNKRPGHELHDTARGGDALLLKVFEAMHAQPARQNLIPPFFIFEKYATPTSSRSFQFRGLAAPGYPGLPAISNLVAVWKTTGGQRFQNYRAVYTVLDAPIIRRAWIKDLLGGDVLTLDCPQAWLDWVQHGRYDALTSESTTHIR